MKIQILGPGCAKCQTLASHAEAAAQELGLEYEIEKITGMDAIMDYGVMMTPALAVDGEVKSSGKIVTAEEIKGMLR